MSVRIAAGIAAAILALPSVRAQDLPEFEAVMEDARARLGLTEEQVEQLMPILAARFEAQVAILEEHGIRGESGDVGGRSSLENLRQLERALGESNAGFDAPLATVLTGAQMEEFSAMRAEVAAQARDAILTRWVEEIGRRISLDEEQLGPFKPIYSDHVEAQKAILDEHGIEFGAEGGSRTRLRTLLALRRDLRDADEATLERLSAVLTAEQLAAYRAIQDEQRERNRDRIR